MVKCEICGKEFESLKNLSIHIRSHNIITKEYYDIYLKKDNEGICELEGCKNETKYYGLIKGYSKFCCVDHSNKSEQTKSRIVKTCLEKFGEISPWKNKEFVKEKQDEYFEKNGIRSANEKPEVREKLSNKLSSFWKSENGEIIKKNYSEKRKGKKRSEEDCEKIRIAVNKPEYREKYIERLNAPGFKEKRGKSLSESWKDPEVRKRYREGHKNSEKVKKANEKTRERMLNGHAAYMRTFIECPSKPQVELYNIVKEIFSTAKLECQILNYNVDIGIPELKIAIEYDESYNHDRKGVAEQDNKRQTEIENEGWEFLRYKDYIPTKDEIIKDMNKYLFKGDG